MFLPRELPEHSLELVPAMSEGMQDLLTPRGYSIADAGRGTGDFMFEFVDTLPKLCQPLFLPLGLIEKFGNAGSERPFNRTLGRVRTIRAMSIVGVPLDAVVLP